MVWDKVCVLGVGLLGGSLARAIKATNPGCRVAGWGRSPEKIDAAMRAEIIDWGTCDLLQAAHDADLLIAATPVQSIVQTLALAWQVVNSDCLIVDVGSTKANIAAAAKELPLAANFCPSHPIAGGEKSGAEHADAALFRDKMVVLTPMPTTSSTTLNEATIMWQSVGARTCVMTPQEHDAALAVTSHLPHLVASAVAAGTTKELLHLVGSGWSDTTRIAAGDPVLWRQIVEENRVDALQAMQSFATIWGKLIDAVQHEDFNAIERLLQEGKRIRDAVGN